MKHAFPLFALTGLMLCLHHPHFVSPVKDQETNTYTQAQATLLARHMSMTGLQGPNRRACVIQKYGKYDATYGAIPQGWRVCRTFSHR